MIKFLTCFLLTTAFALTGCKTMKTANQKMEVVNKAVNNADAKFREKVGLAPYEADKNSAASKE